MPHPIRAGLFVVFAANMAIGPAATPAQRDHMRLDLSLSVSFRADTRRPEDNVQRERMSAVGRSQSKNRVIEIALMRRHHHGRKSSAQNSVAPEPLFYPISWRLRYNGS
jgi:hypothetical protein